MPRFECCFHQKQIGKKSVNLSFLSHTPEDLFWVRGGGVIHSKWALNYQTASVIFSRRKGAIIFNMWIYLSKT